MSETRQPQQVSFIVPSQPLRQRFATFLMLRPFNPVPCVVVTPNDKIIFLLLHNSHFATGNESKCKFLHFPVVLGDLRERVIHPPAGVATHRLRITGLSSPDSSLWDIYIYI